MNRGARWEWLDEVRNRMRTKSLSANAHHVALTLGVHYINGSREAWPSQAELVEVTGRSFSTVRRALHELEEAGLLEVHRGGPGHTSGNVYRLREAVTLTASRGESNGVTAKRSHVSNFSDAKSVTTLAIRGFCSLLLFHRSQGPLRTGHTDRFSGVA